MFSDRLTVNLAGITLELVHAPGETNDQIIVWYPEQVNLYDDKSDLSMMNMIIMILILNPNMMLVAPTDHCLKSFSALYSYMIIYQS